VILSTLRHARVRRGFFAAFLFTAKNFFILQHLEHQTHQTFSNRFLITKEKFCLDQIQHLSLYQIQLQN